MKALLLLPLFLAFTTLLAGESMIHAMIAPNPFVIEKEKVAEITTKHKISVYQLLNELIPEAKVFSRPPISQYRVGVAALGKSGNIYLGVNIEMMNCPLNESVHAEQFLVANARSHGEKELVAIALSAAPCGHCRQFLNEMGGGEILIMTPQSENQTLSSLLPQAFGPSDLGLEATLMHQPESIPVFEGVSPLTAKALQAAYVSHAPYSGSKSGIAIQTKDGSIYSGSYLENVAFNPSLSPLQSALVALVIGMQEYSNISHVVLAEQQNSKISQECMGRHITQILAPKATFETVKF